MSTPDTNPDEPDAFGFARTARDKIRNIQPSTAPPVPDLQKVDAIAESAGFVSREAPRQPASPAYSTVSQPEIPVRKPTVAINMRVPVDVANAFIRFCKEERYSYPEGLEEIMKRAGIPTV
jgi:hypothetical protein